MINERILKMSVSEAEATLASLRTEISEESRSLTALYVEKEAVKAERAIFSGEKVAFERYKAEQEAEIALERATMTQERSKMQSEAKLHEEAIRRIKEQNRLALKDLEWVNDKIIKGKEEIGELNKTIEELNKTIAEKEVLMTNLVLLKDEIVILEDRRNEVKIETSLMVDNSNEAVVKAKRELAVIITERDATVSAMNQAEYRLKEFNDSLVKKTSDFNIYRKRLETYYKQAFPDLVIKL